MGTEAVDLLKPDVSPERSASKHVEEEEDDLEALRLAALRSMKPRKPQGYMLQPHPCRTNLLTIVVNEERREEKAAPPSVLPRLPAAAGMKPSSSSLKDKKMSQSNDKFSRYKDNDKSSSDEEEDEEDYGEEDDELKLHATAEVDELTQLLDDLEDKVLKEPSSSSGGKKGARRRPLSPTSRSPTHHKRRRHRSRSPPHHHYSSSGTTTTSNGKSKSLPPAANASRLRVADEGRKQQRAARLSSPEREKRLARQKKFTSPLRLPDGGKRKVISLKNIKEDSSNSARGVVSPASSSVRSSHSFEDAISLSVEDTLDMFDEDDGNIRASKRKHVSLSANASPSSGVMDLRVALYKKRQQKMGSKPPASGGSNSSLGSNTYIEEQRVVSLDEGEDNAVLESSSEGEDKSSYNGHTKKARRVLIREVASSESTEASHKKKTQRPSIMSRLGDPVSSFDRNPRSPTPEVLVVLGKSPKKKKDKKEKRKKSKKDKKEKKKSSGSKSSRPKGGSSSDEAPSEDENNIDDEDEELFKFFEEEESTSSSTVAPGGEKSSDELMKRMEKKNMARLKRLKEIEEDKMLHT